MANNVMFNVSENFQMDAFAAQLADAYRAKGYTVNVANMNNNCMITFDKNTGGINMLLGMGEGIKATCMISNGALSISFSDGDWIGKIIGFIAGWFLCLIPIVTAAIGTVRQSKLPKDIANDAAMIASQF